MVMASSLAPANGYESLIVIASMSISGLMLAFSIGAIGYVFHKRFAGFALHLIPARTKRPGRIVYDDIAPSYHSPILCYLALSHYLYLAVSGSPMIPGGFCPLNARI